MPWHASPVLRPLPAEGVYFHRRQFKTFNHVPHPSKTMAYGASWFSMDDDKGAQPCCHVVSEMDKDRRLYIVECHHAWLPLQEAISWQFKIHGAIHRTTVEATSYPKKADIYGVRVWFCSQDQFGGGIDEMVHQEEQRRRVASPSQNHAIPLASLPNAFDLTSASRVLQSEIIAGRILMPVSDPWVNDFLEEACQWPAVRTDARIKAMCVLMSALPNMTPPAPSEVGEHGRGSPWAA